MFCTSGAVVELRPADHRRQDAEEHGVSPEHRQHVVSLGVLPEGRLELLELLRVLRSDVAGLREVVRQVVELPLLRVRVVEAGGELAQRLLRDVPGELERLAARPPAVLVHPVVAEALEVLPRVALLGLGVGERVGEAGALDRPLLDPVHAHGLGDPRDLEDRRGEVDAVSELLPQPASVLDPPRPRDHHRVAGAAEVAGQLLAPLERGIAGPAPAGGIVRRGQRPAPCVEAAVLLDLLELLLSGERDPVVDDELVESARRRALHAGAVVAPDVDHERVVELAQLLQRVEQPADVVVRVLLVARVHLHLPGVELPLLVRQRVPGRHRVGPGRELRVLGDDAELLLALQRLLAVAVPALVEAARVLVGPVLGDVMRRMSAPGREVHEERLLLVLRPHPVQPLDRLVGHRVREVEVLVLGHADRRVVLRDHGIELARLAAEEAPEVVEAPGVRPAVEGARRALHVVGRQVPLAEGRGDVAVHLQGLRDRSAALRQRGRVSGERARELAERAEPDRVVVAAGQGRRPGGRADRGDVEAVVAQAGVGDPRQVRGLDRAAEGLRVAEARVVDQHEQDVGRPQRRAHRSQHRPVGLRGVKGATGLPLELRVGHRQHGAIDRVHAALLRLVIELSRSNHRGRFGASSDEDERRLRGDIRSQLRSRSCELRKVDRGWVGAVSTASGRSEP